MNKLAKILVGAAAAAAIAPVMAADPGTPFFGRAGLPAAHERVAQIGPSSQLTGAGTATVEVGYGRAGGPGALAASKTTSEQKSESAARTPQVYGRAGGPAPFGG